MKIQHIKVTNMDSPKSGHPVANQFVISTGEPYVTHFLLAEAFNAKNGEAKIPAEVLRARLPEAIKLAIKRGKEVYKEKLTEKSPEVKSFIDFVELCEKKEKETGEPVTIIASY